MYDFIFRVPVFEDSQVPLPNSQNCTASRRAFLITSGLISKEEKRGYRRTLSDAADREYGAWKSIPKVPGREGQRLRRIMPDVPEVDFEEALRVWDAGG